VTQQLTVDIARDRTAPAAARQAVEGFDAISPDVVPDVKLLVSELITNSVKYGGDGLVTLILRSEAPEHVHVEVVDQGSGFVPVARARPKTEPGGWGLHMVETLTERWGVHEGSTHVWFEIDRRRAE
jgi:anti-sigma regulatory factor (Ser/Thr protein kinase)